MATALTIAFLLVLIVLWQSMPDTRDPDDYT